MNSERGSSAPAGRRKWSAPDAGLGVLLREYARKTDADPERVFVSVERDAGFQNIARTTAGLEVRLDEPVSFGGRGDAADPAECLLAAVGASLSVALTAHASMRDVSIDHIEVSLMASMDADAFFRPGTGTPGLMEAAIELFVRSAAPASVIEALVAAAAAASPVLRALAVRPDIRLVIEGAV